MKTLIVVTACLMASVSLMAQRHKLTINAETPEGALLQQIGTEADAAKKTELMEQFTEKFPKHEAAAWVYAQLAPAYLKANQPDKSMAAAEKLLALDPGDVEIAHGALKAAEAKKDPDGIRKWAVITSDAARKMVASPQPKDEDEVEEWKRLVDFSKQVDTYTEYSMYAAALQTTDARKRIELFETIEKRNPQSQYVQQSLEPYLAALTMAGEKAKAAQVAEKAASSANAGEDVILAAASGAYEAKNFEKASGYSEKLIALLNSKPKPETMAEADWHKKKNLMLGVAYWMNGVIQSNAGRWVEADKTLRTALPLSEENKALAAEALFHLGLANYKLGDKPQDSKRILEALQFNQRCAAIPGPFQAQARKNIAAIRSQYHIK